MNTEKVEGLGRDVLLSRLAAAECKVDSVLLVLEQSLLLWAAARAAYEANRAYCQFIGDTAQPAWDQAAQWQKDSVQNGVWAIIENVNLTPKESHASWTACKLKEGWVYGPVKDVETKTHPCMVPYDELPIVQQFKDTLFGAVVRGVLGISKEPKT